jgi:glutaredoxin 3
VSFEERDVSRDEAALEDLRRIGATATPVLVIDGETVIGFDRERIEELLAV